ncbi:flagellar export protein FliJ [[Eubacterium] yurii subsp. margaretiae ATCC 43715]|nr:flagellar export protein FliJ [[Eubacterium] yurii subsp. margaretiae ATCC 43715]
MAYKFRLQKVLDVKEKEEDNKKNEMSLVNFEIEKAKKQLHELYDELEENSKQRQDKNSSGSSIQELLELNKYIDYLKNTAIRQKIEEIENLQKKLEDRKEEFIDIRRQRKSYENLKDKDYQKFLEKESKDEEKIIDEIVSFTARKTN